MNDSILTTKLYKPKRRLQTVSREPLLARMNEGRDRKLILISAPAGFGKTTLLSEWADGCSCPIAWLSLDDGDREPARFLLYMIAAMQTVDESIGKGLIGPVQTVQDLPTERILTVLLNSVAELTTPIVLVLDDYHTAESDAVNRLLVFILDHLPANMHLVISSRKDPDISLSRLRVRDQIVELRGRDLRFSTPEAASFLNRIMGLCLSPEEVGKLESKTEGWIAGLQLVALSLQGHNDSAGFIQSFTGNHPFVIDYLAEEVLEQLSDDVKRFLMITSILDRFSAPLCEALVGLAPGMGQSILAYLECENLFLIPLDNNRTWYRYHHLFVDFLRKRLGQRVLTNGTESLPVNEYHTRASLWFEENNLETEAFRHAASSGDIPRVEHLINGGGMPLYYRGYTTVIREWLESLPVDCLNSRPSLWFTYAMVFLMAGKPSQAEDKLANAESLLRISDDREALLDLKGQIEAARALIDAGQNRTEGILDHAHNALRNLHPSNDSARTLARFSLGVAYQMTGKRAEAVDIFREVSASGQTSGNYTCTIAALSSLGNMMEEENHLHDAAQTYHQILTMVGDMGDWIAFSAHGGLTRIYYEWNDLKKSLHHATYFTLLAPQLECHTKALCNVQLARLKAAAGQMRDAASLLSEAAGEVSRQSPQTEDAGEVSRQSPQTEAAGEISRHSPQSVELQEIISEQVRILLLQGNLAEAGRIAEQYDLPQSRVRVCLARGEASAAVDLLCPLRKQAEEGSRSDELLTIIVLEALALHASGRDADAMDRIREALAMAEPGGMIRLFLDEGEPMVDLLRLAREAGMFPDYTGKLLDAFRKGVSGEKNATDTGAPDQAKLVEPLSERETEILRLIAQGLSNQEIGDRLFLALPTIKWHNRIIFDKLQVQRRTEAVAKARELGLIEGV